MCEALQLNFMYYLITPTVTGVNPMLINGQSSLTHAGGHTQSGFMHYCLDLKLLSHFLHLTTPYLKKKHAHISSWLVTHLELSGIFQAFLVPLLESAVCLLADTWWQFCTFLPCMMMIIWCSAFILQVCVVIIGLKFSFLSERFSAETTPCCL